MQQLKTSDIRNEFVRILSEKKFTTVNREASMTGLTGNTTIEIVNASFIADEESIFGEVNWDYVKREEEWYNSMSRSVHSIPGGAPQIWKAVADKDGLINSNYGWAIYSPENGFIPDTKLQHWHSPEEVAYFEGVMLNWTTRFTNAEDIIACQRSSQYSKTLEELKKNPESRRAIMIHTRPSMWLDYNLNGRSDFMCTNAVQYLIRDGAVHAVVQMRSNDGWAGYRNDRAWQQHVLEKLAGDLGLPAGNLYWNVGSLHIYARNYYLVDYYSKTGKIHISKDEYKSLYPDSQFAK